MAADNLGKQEFVFLLSDFQIVTHRCGYKSVSPLPSESELNDYYETKYWQSPDRPHTAEYSQEERHYRQIRNSLTLNMVPRATLDYGRTPNSGRALDIGCGEGFMLKSLRDFGYEATGVDFESFGVSAHNPDCLPLVKTGHIPDTLSSLVSSGEEFDLVLLNCVLEHVREPDKLLEVARKLLRVEGFLVVSVPNDFSWLQALANRDSNTSHFVTPPDHLHYFSKRSLIELVSSKGFEHVSSMSDFPIEIFLLNEFSDYVQGNHKGKSAHEARIAFENRLFEECDPHLVMQFWESCANVGLGRTVTSVFSVCNSGGEDHSGQLNS